MKVNEKEILIMIHNEDRTKEIDSIIYSPNLNKYIITFNGSIKKFYYSHESVEIYEDAKIVDLKDALVMNKEQQVDGVVMAIIFNEKYVKLFFSNKSSKLYYKQDIYFEKSSLANKKAFDCFDYLKQVSKITSIKTDNDKLLLNAQYEKMEHINPNSILAKYINYKGIENKDIRGNIIFPFGFNLSQKAAVENAFSHNISIIEGPPGTGKTQTILNIIANAVVNGKTVAVVSNNNSATSNVIEKLEKNKLSFFAAFLGNRDNKDKFIELQSEEYPSFNGWSLPTIEINDLSESLEEQKELLCDMNESRNLEAQKTNELDGLKTEYQYFKDYFDGLDTPEIKIKKLFGFDSKHISELIIYLETKQENKPLFSILDKVILFFTYGIYDLKMYTISIEKIIDNLRLIYYKNRIEEIETTIQNLQAQLKSYSFETKTDEYQKDSMDLFRAKLFLRYSRGKRQLFTKDDFWKNTDSFMAEYPVVLSTTHSLRNCTNTSYLYDYLIIDEASQVDIVTGALALSCAKNVIIVGDDKQLPNVVPEIIKTATDSIFDTYKLKEAYKYASNSLLSSCIKVFNDAPRTLLKEHYRCHPKIIDFCNKKFYNNQLIILNKNKGKEPLCVYKTAEGNHSRDHYNQRQIDVIINEIFTQKKIGMGLESVGIITPYVNQKDHLNSIIKNDNIEIDTVHKFQGREKDVIIISTVDDDINEFSDNPNLLNVAISRAISKLILVVPNKYSKENSNMGDLIKYIEYNNFEVVNSKIYSVFDYLYKDYSRSLIKELTNYENVSKYESENLMNTVIKETLEMPELNHLDYILGQPLKMLIKDNTLLDEQEIKFVKSGSHTDFLIYSKVSKEPVLVVEVDGYAFHESNNYQLKRDEIKDSILNKYGIPIIRFKTNESNEKERLKNKLLQKNI